MSITPTKRSSIAYPALQRPHKMPATTASASERMIDSGGTAHPHGCCRCGRETATTRGRACAAKELRTGIRSKRKRCVNA